MTGIKINHDFGHVRRRTGSASFKQPPEGLERFFRAEVEFFDRIMLNVMYGLVNIIGKEKKVHVIGGDGALLFH